MPEQMTRIERVRAILLGKEVDRPPVSVWRHFYDRETSAQGLAEALLSFQHGFDWDFMKVNPRASFHVEDWGVRVKYGSDPYEAPEKVDWPIKQPSDWDRVQPLNVQQGVLGEQLEALRLIAQGLKGQVPFVMTVFTPLSIAGRLTGSNEAMKTNIRQCPEKVHRALEVVTETFSNFARECINLGAWGIFYATSYWATYDRLTDQEYAEFGRPYDLKLLQALPKAEFHILHVCESNNMLRPLADYPVHAFNWDTEDTTNVGLREGREITQKAVIGGIGHRTTLVKGQPQDVVREVERDRKEMGKKGWMFGSGCTFPPHVPEENLRALKEAVSA